MKGVLYMICGICTKYSTTESIAVPKIQKVTLRGISQKWAALKTQMLNVWYIYVYLYTYIYHKN